MGDKLLVEASKRMKECLREVDTVARLGGDEFLILLPDMEDPTSSSVVAEKILSALCRPFYINGEEIRV